MLAICKGADLSSVAEHPLLEFKSGRQVLNGEKLDSFWLDQATRSRCCAADSVSLRRRTDPTTLRWQFGA